MHGIAYLTVGGQFKKRQTIQSKNVLIGRDGFGSIPLCDEHAELRLKRIKENTMTFIITGISNGKTFLMSDCIGTEKVNEERVFKYKNKLNKLISPKEQTYFCLAGSDCYGYAINCFDRECYEKNKTFDFKNEEHISEVLEIFKQIKKHRENQGHKIKNYARLYFVDKTDVYYYDTTDSGKIFQLKNLKSNNCYIEPNITEQPPVKLDHQFKDNQELISFCKNEINNVQDYNIDLKDKFSYVIFDDKEIIFDNSIKNNNELVLSLIVGSYNEIK